jgi:hypothetical protein
MDWERKPAATKRFFFSEERGESWRKAVKMGVREKRKNKE